MARILQVNKYYYRKGGAESVMLDTMSVLESCGHEVIPFAMEHLENIASPYAKYFVSNVDYDEGTKMNAMAKIKAAANIIYSFEARKKMESLIADLKPDIAHMHIIYHQLSPSFLAPLKKHRIPTVMTLHDFKLMCPKYTFLSSKGVCEKCAGGSYYHAVSERCVKDSIMKSVVSMVEMYVHTILQLYDNGIDLFISPSEFLKNKFVSNGRLSEDRIVHLPNAVDVSKYQPVYENRGYVLYFGRIEDYKGVFVLAEAMAKIPDTRLILAGTGKPEPELRSMLLKQGIRNVELVGYQTGEPLAELIRGASAVIVPSIWYENCPMTILEAFAYGKPVIGSRLGGITELITDGMDGLLIEPGNADELAACITSINGNPLLAAQMGAKGRDKVVERYSFEKYTDSLLHIYNRIDPSLDFGIK